MTLHHLKYTIKLSDPLTTGLHTCDWSIKLFSFYFLVWLLTEYRNDLAPWNPKTHRFVLILEALIQGWMSFQFFFNRTCYSETRREDVCLWLVPLSSFKCEAHAYQKCRNTKLVNQTQRRKESVFACRHTHTCTHTHNEGCQIS